MSDEFTFSVADYKVREGVTPDDRSSIFRILNTSGYFLPREMAYGMDLFDEHLRRGENSSYKFILYEQDAALLGYASYGPVKYSDRRYHLHWLAVDRNHQHHGLGRIIEAAVVAKVRALGGSRLYAEVSNREHHTKARQFYEKCGYSLAASLPDYYADGSDTLFYAKEL